MNTADKSNRVSKEPRIGTPNTNTASAAAPSVDSMPSAKYGSSLPTRISATEAGVDRVVPWRAERCVARWDDGERGAKARARWCNAVREAAKQSRRAWCPEVTEPVDTPGLARLATAASAALVLHESAERGIAELTLPRAGDLLIVVGPEGGITDAELATLASGGATPVRLGQTVLRASTAAAVALGAIGVLTSRWRQPHA